MWKQSRVIYFYTFLSNLNFSSFWSTDDHFVLQLADDKTNRKWFLRGILFPARSDHSATVMIAIYFDWNSSFHYKAEIQQETIVKYWEWCYLHIVALSIHFLSDSG